MILLSKETPYDIISQGTFLFGCLKQNVLSVRTTSLHQYTSSILCRQNCNLL